MGAGEVRRIERWLATARVFLATAALVTVWMDPEQIRYSLWAQGLLAFYLAQSMVIILLLRRRQQSTHSFRILVHAGDIIWPALISVFAASQLIAGVYGRLSLPRPFPYCFFGLTRRFSIM